VALRPARRLAALCAAPVAALGLVLGAAPAAADPAADLARVQSEVDALRTEAAAAGERYNATRLELDRKRTLLAAAKDRQEQQRAVVTDLQDARGRLAAAAYRGAGVERTVQFILADDPVEYLLGGSRIDRVAARQSDVLAGLEKAEQRLAADRAAVSAQVEDVAADEKSLAADRKKVDDRLAAAQARLDALTAAERQRLAAERAAADQAAVLSATAPGERAAGARASRSAGRSAPTAAGAPTAPGAAGTTSCGGVSVPVPSARVRAVIDTACAQLGKPYVWGASGPGAYDCSGLTLTAWAAGGVSLPHSSKAQATMGTPVGRGSVQAGDLVFSYSPISHVGIALGNGLMIAAPSSGDVVKVQPMSQVPFNRAVRL
jgi:peptidoglycan DL-endopeptidase CwlO